MALKVCNGCGVRWNGEDTCPACLGAGRGDVRDFHYAYEEGAAEPVITDDQIPSDEDGDGEPDDEDSEGKQESQDSIIGDLTPEALQKHSRNRLSALARELGLDPSGTKAELVDRISEEGHR